MSEFLRRRHRMVTERRPLAEQVVVPLKPDAAAAPIAIQEKPAAQIGDRREIVGTDLTMIARQDSTRRGIRFRNVGATVLYVGGPGVTADTAVIRIDPGYIWEESLAAAATWYAVSSASNGAMTIQEVR